MAIGMFNERKSDFRISTLDVGIWLYKIDFKNIVIVDRFIYSLFEYCFF